MSKSGLTIAECLEEMSSLLDRMAAVARAASVCATAGAEQEALRIAIDIDEGLHEVQAFHGALRLIGRVRKPSAATAFAAVR